MFAKQAWALNFRDTRLRENSLKIKPMQTVIPLTTIYYLQIENTTLDTPLTLAYTIEKITDNEISIELVDTSRPSDSIETERIPISHISMKIQTI